MRDQITNYVQACPTCQKNKRKVKKYGWLPPKEAEAEPWDKLCIDLSEERDKTHLYVGV